MLEILTQSQDSQKQATTVWIVASVVVIALTLVGCRQSTAVPARPAPSVVVATPLKMNIVEWDEFVGRFAAIESVNV